MNLLLLDIYYIIIYVIIIIYLILSYIHQISSVYSTYQSELIISVLDCIIIIMISNNLYTYRLMIKIYPSINYFLIELLITFLDYYIFLPYLNNLQLLSMHRMKILYN